MTSRPVSPPTPEPEDPPVLDSVDRRVQSIFYEAFIEAHGITRLPGSVYIDENGEVA